ncbi:MAG TPA: hypothetical protein VL295_00715 [Gemmatimonadales bacterium]|nr:hypothetical protein [Gemmatimonadales bacterium]
MAQRVRLDPFATALYLALGMLGACKPTLAGVVPVGAVEVSLDSVPVWAAAAAPEGRILHRFKWLYHDERSSIGGRGSVRIAAPDSLRFDVAGPLGANPAAAMVVGDSAIWIDAPQSIHDIVPSYPLLWAGFGIVHPPANATLIWAGRAGGVVAWRMTAGADTVEYALTRTGARRLVAEVRSGGKVTARMDAELSADGRPAKARLLVPSRPARLDLTFTLSDPSARFPAEVWHPRRP